MKTACTVEGLSFHTHHFLAVMTPEDVREQAESGDIDREMERLAFIGTLAEGLAHEIRNPLSTINVNLQLLKEDWKDADGEKETQTVERVEMLLDETNRLEEVLNNFLQFAQGMDLELEDVDLNGFVRDLVNFYKPETDQENIEMATDLESTLPLVSIDTSKFRQAIENILKNALQELQEKGGTITIGTRTVDEDRAELFIKDNGSGIPPEKLDKVFEVYYSTKKGGSGLGLPIARRIIKEHGGSVQIESTINEGSTVRVRLPGNGALSTE